MQSPSIRTLLTLTCLIVSPAVLAQVNITITGQIDEVTCTPVATGTTLSGNTLTLAPKQLPALNASDPSVPGGNLVFTLTGCGMSSAINNMWVHFTAGSIDNGRINTNNTQVAFQIRDIDSSGALGGQVDVGGTAAATGPTANQGTPAAFTGSFPTRNASKSYAVHYYRKGAIVDQAGTVTATATYTVKYY